MKTNIKFWNSVAFRLEWLIEHIDQGHVECTTAYRELLVSHIEDIANRNVHRFPIFIMTIGNELYRELKKKGYSYE